MRKKVLAFVQKNGFYAALALCLGLLGAIAYWARSLPPRTPQVAPAATAEAKTVPALVQSDEPLHEPHAPVGEMAVLVERSDDPVWSATLLQWQPHAGVDLEAELGAVVYAVLEGTVTAAYKDALLGNTIEIAHADGLITRYASLSTLGLVEEGKAVSRGEAIGAVGQTAIAESALPPHLHFESSKDGQWVDLFAFD